MMPRRWKLAASVAVGVFGAGVTVGYLAHKRGIAQDQVGRWLLKEATRKALHAYDTLRDLLPDEEAVAVEVVLGEEPPATPS